MDDDEHIQKVHVDQEYSFLKNDPCLVAHSIAMDMPLEDDFCQNCGYIFSGLTKWICSNQSICKQTLREYSYKYIRQGEKNDFTNPAGYVLSNVVQYAGSLHCCKVALLTHIQTDIFQDLLFLQICV